MASTSDNLRVRSYQQEMLEKSLQGNAIIMLETGSGKTVIAALRIRAALETCLPHQYVWFLTPGVELCRQQHKFLGDFFPQYRTRLLIGEDNMDRWKDQRIWDAALDQVKIVVSTFAVLADALQHTFVQLSDLTLLVFDEAHHCNKNHPANDIMQKSYFPAKARGRQPLPHILGLSASLIIKSDIRSLHTLEANLDAISVTPREHRQEVSKHVKPPQFVRLVYDEGRPLDEISWLDPPRDLRIMLWLSRLGDYMPTADLDMADSIKYHLGKYSRILLSDGIYLGTTLGQWAADHYMSHAMQRLASRAMTQDDLLQEPRQVAKHLIVNSYHDQFPNPLSSSLQTGIGPKVRCLVEYLTKLPDENTVGLIFVERRITTRIIADLLNDHPLTRGKFRCAPIVGSSGHPMDAQHAKDLVDLGTRENTLARFRTGELNILVTTDLLEEGIDVPRCNLVICFDLPKNVKSYIQRRGRARDLDSSYVFVAEKSRDLQNIVKWQELEREMTLICQMERSMIADDDQKTEVGYDDLSLVHPESGAIITLDSAVQHLQHFCDHLPDEPYNDRRPIYAFTEVSGGLIEATVTLPAAVSLSIRHASSTKGWRMEKSAARDAALAAYVGLYHAGLLNRHLLPLIHDLKPTADFEPLKQNLLERPSILDIWKARETTERSFCYDTFISICDEDGEDVKLILSTSAPPVRPPDFRLRSAEGRNFRIHVSEACTQLARDDFQLDLFKQSTELIYRCSRSHRLEIMKDHLSVLIRPAVEDVSAWLIDNAGVEKVEELLHALISQKSIIRVPYMHRSAYVYHGQLTGENDSTQKITCFPSKKYHLLKSKFENGTATDKDYSRHIFPIEACEVDRMHHIYVQPSRFLPQIIVQIHDYTMAKRLHDHLLPDVPYNDLNHIMTAIRAPKAMRGTHYQQLEFIGDCVLKLIVSRQLYNDHTNWTEGYLSKRRSYLICNERLASEALDRGLDRYILTEPVTAKEWVLPHQSSKAASTRQMPVKLLADVVEALIGATFVDTQQNYSATQMCVNRLLPGIRPQVSPFSLPPTAPPAFTERLKDLELLVGRNFKHKAILAQAITLSSAGSTYARESYQRLEFLGDAVLDILIVTNIIKREDKTSAFKPGYLTQLRAALVNKHLLGFFCLHFRKIVIVDSVVTDRRTGNFEMMAGQRDIRLWKFLEPKSEPIVKAFSATKSRYEERMSDLEQCIRDPAGRPYPWEMLMDLRVEKFYSDMIEGMLGAIFVDSDGDLASCEEFLDRIGLIAYLDGLMRDKVDVKHPTAIVQETAAIEEAVQE